MNLMLSQRIQNATEAVFGSSPISHQVQAACTKYESEVQNIQAGRGVGALLIAIVGAKGQGKTWVTRQFIRSEQTRRQLRSGDLVDDATTRLVWIGPLPPENLELSDEIYHACAASEMVEIGQPYILLDTPGMTDANHRAAQLARDSLTVAPVKLLVIARDQTRAATNMTISREIEGSVCIPVITSVEPEETDGGRAIGELADDLRSLRDQLSLLAPTTTLPQDVLIPDFEFTGDEPASEQACIGALLDRFNELGITERRIGDARQLRLQAAERRLREKVCGAIESELPQLSAAVEQLGRETEYIPERVLDSLLGSESVLETGVRLRLRAQLVSDTSLLWFPYRTIMSTLNITQGAWDRVMLALAGSVPSLFGALASWAKNIKQNQDFSSEVREGIKTRTQEQVEQRLRPLCEQFHRTVQRLRPRDDRTADDTTSQGMRLTGIDELQTKSQQIFDTQIRKNALANIWVQLLALGGVILFWIFMAGPIVLIYREYFTASTSVLTGQEIALENFPHPTPSLLFTSLLLSLLPLALYCMLVLTWALSKRKVRHVSANIVGEHESTIKQLKQDNIIRLHFDDELLQQAEFLLNLRTT